MEKSNTKRAIFQAALDLFRKNGYENVSVQMICNAAGTTRNAFYYYYDSKEDLLSSYLDYLSPSDSGMMEGILKQPDDWSKLLYIYEFHTRLFIQEGSDFARQLIVACIQSKKNMVGQYALSSSLCIPLIQQCQVNGYIRSPLPAEKLDHFVSRIFYAAIIEWSLSDDASPDITMHILQLITDLLRPELSAAPGMK